MRNCRKERMRLAMIVSIKLSCAILFRFLDTGSGVVWQLLVKMFREIRLGVKLAEE